MAWSKFVAIKQLADENPKDFVNRYEQSVTALKNANMKISPNKTHIFPTSVDVLGWVWSRGGFLSPSPHRQCALTNVKQDDIKKVKDMRSYIGLYTMLHMVTMAISYILTLI